MIALSVPSRRPVRVLFALLALAANLIATGVPVLHALAHADQAPREGHGHAHEHHHEYEAGHSSGEEDHEEVHPASLHDDSLLTQPGPIDFGIWLPAEPYLLSTVADAGVVPRTPSSSLRSRAPPRAGLPRAPPLV